MTITDRTEEWLEEVQMEAAQRLLRAAFTLQTEMKINLSTAYPPASVPGEYPHGRTWNGRDSLVVMPETAREIMQLGYVRVGYLPAAWYMPYLEIERGRLGLLLCYSQMFDELQKIIAGYD